MDLIDYKTLIDTALCKAFYLGQTYWQQADSESYSENTKSEGTRKKFNNLVENTLTLFDVNIEGDSDGN